MGWIKREGTTRKVEPYAKLLEKEKCSFHRVISKFVLEHNIPPDLMLNLDQTPPVLFDRIMNLKFNIFN